MNIEFLGNIFPTSTRKNPNQGRVYSPYGLAPTLNCKGGGNLEPFILINIKEIMEKGNGQIPIISINEPINIMSDETCYAIKNKCYKASQANFERNLIFGTTKVNNRLAIRKLTPKEYFRLMGFQDSDVDILIKNGISNTQLYKMAGNSIVVNVIEFLFCQIFDSDNKIWV